MYLNGTGIRKLSEFMCCSAYLVVRWIRLFANNLRNSLSDASESLPTEQLPDIIEMERFTLR